MNALRTENYRDDDYIFPIVNKEMTAREAKSRIKQFIKNTNKWIQIMAEKLDINPKITTYFGRHTYATVLMKQGKPISLIQETLGHHSPVTTNNYLGSFGNEEIDRENGGLL